MADILLRLTAKLILIHQEVGSQKLHIDFGYKSSIRRCMAKSAHDDVRELFAEIGCIMEDVSLIALVWSSTDYLEVRARFQTLSQAHKEIGDLLLRIEDPA